MKLASKHNGLQIRFLNDFLARHLKKLFFSLVVSSSSRFLQVVINVSSPMALQVNRGGVGEGA